MKLKIIRNDNVIIELDGTTDEVKAIIGDVLPSQYFTIQYPGIGTSSPMTYPYLDLTGCSHEYPENWNSTMPPSCIKCGRVT